MFVLTNKETTFTTLLGHAMCQRGVDFTIYGEENLSKSSAAPGTVYVCELESDFKADDKSKFIDFLKKNKFKRAVVATFGGQELQVERLLNGAIIVVRIPSLDNDV